MPHSNISATTAAFATSREPTINRCGFTRPTVTCLPFAPCDNKYYKMVSKYGKLSGTSSFCPFGKVPRVLLVQIILGSDYSGSMKELQRLLQPVLRNVSLKKSLKKKNRKEEQNGLWTVFW